MRRHREAFFLASKIDQRTYADAYHQIQHSLERLQTDAIDLIQLHNLVDPDEWRRALGPDGALEAAVEAHEKGYVRYIGVTGHGMTVADRHRHSLGRFPFDSVLLPYNYSFMQDPGYRADFEALRTLCHDRGVAIQTIKSLARGRWDGKHQTHQTWYEPLSEQEDIDAAVHYVLARPDLFLITSGDPTLLRRIIDAAERFEPDVDLAEVEAHLESLNLRPLFVETDRI
jgi:aryl-alcohol dehydrogenase-like predicted oxidoreductase